MLFKRQHRGSGVAFFINKGFSLFELITVLVIVGIAAAVILPNLQSAMERTNAQTAKNNLLAISAAQEKFYEDYSSSCSSSGISPCYCVLGGTNPTGQTVSCGDSEADLNTNLHLSFSDPNYNYFCDSGAAPYECSAVGSILNLTLSVNSVTMAATVGCTTSVPGDCPD